MNGKWLYDLVLENLDQISAAGSYVTERQVFTALDRAAEIFVRETGSITNTATITTVADQQAYTLDPDFIRPAVVERTRRAVLKSDDGTNTRFAVATSYDRIFLADETTAKEHPDGFCVRPRQTAGTTISGTAATAGASGNDGAVLWAASGLSAAKVRDVVQNITSGAIGLVLTASSDTAVTTVLFDSNGARAGWTVSDSFVIVPAADLEIYLDAPSKTAGYTLTLPYVSRPNPVYTPFGMWRINPRHAMAIANGAAMILKSPKRDFSGSLQIGGLFSEEIARCKRDQARAVLDSLHWR